MGDQQIRLDNFVGALPTTLRFRRRQHQGQRSRRMTFTRRTTTAPRLTAGRKRGTLGGPRHQVEAETVTSLPDGQYPGSSSHDVPASASKSGPVPWHALEYADVLERLDSSPTGLDAAEASDRLVTYGPNELAFAGRQPWWRVLARQFVSPLIAILLVAAVIAAVQQHFVDAVAISLVLTINAAIGFVQERKADADVRALNSLSTPSCRVLRDGAETVIASREVVPGDVVLLESGERVPADLRLFDTNGLRLDESMLTGESAAATKHTAPAPNSATAGDKTCVAFSGTFVASGRGRGLAFATGDATELGEINELVRGPAGETPLQLLTHGLERRIGILVLIAVIFVFIAGLAVGNDPSQMFRTVVALAVATIPESLPIVLTVAMSVGVSRMARLNAIIRTLPAVETLGSTNIIGSDKTGTLTQNLLTVERLWTAEGEVDVSGADRLSGPAATSPMLRAVLRAGALTNEAVRSSARPDEFTGDAVDVAMAALAVGCGAIGDVDDDVIAHQPYEPELQYSQTVCRDAQGRRTLYVKGSPEVVLSSSTTMAGVNGPIPLDSAMILAASERMGADGLRVIATASRVLPDHEDTVSPLQRPAGVTFLGLEGMADPPRPGVAEAVAQCRRAGIQVKMITGDHPVTAMAIAARLGLPTDSPALTGAEAATLDDHMLAARLEQTSVAARVTPQDKLRIVRVLQSRDHVVAVTGDGVNDAPALKAAAIGVAMGKSGTDVAREAADVVLTDDNFVTIVHAVRQGRVTFAAIRKATYFLLSTGAGALVAVSLSVVTEQPLLFLPVQMLWINIVTNGVQDVALALEPAEGDELDRPPRARSEGLLSRTLWFRAAITGVWMALWVLIVFRWALENGYDEVHARTFAMTTFVMLSFFQALSSRAEYKSLFQLRPLGNKPLLFTSVGALILQWGVTVWPVSANLMGLTPLSAPEWLASILVGSTVLVIVEAEKLVRRLSRRARPTRTASATAARLR